MIATTEDVVVAGVLDTEAAEAMAGVDATTTETTGAMAVEAETNKATPTLE